MRSLEARTRQCISGAAALLRRWGEVEHSMAAGGANIGLKDMEPLQVCKYLHDEAEVEQLSDMIAKILMRLSSDKFTTSGVDA